jgi:cyclophilin family peptidyl-prolyl cis-trans isomerase
MWDRIRRAAAPADRHASGAKRQSALRSRRTPCLELLEDRQLMTASLAPISNLSSVPALMGYQLPLDGSGSNSTTQTFTAKSDNPHIQVNVAQGQFWTITVSHQASSTSGDISFTNEPMTFQLFSQLTPITVNQITNLTNNGFYVNEGKFFPRILKGFVAQGGATNATNTLPPPDSAGVPKIANEIVQQLAFNGSAQLAMANTGQPGVNSTQAQFFVTYGPQTNLDYGYSLVGQLVAGQNTLTDLSKVTVHPATPGAEDSIPDSPVTITSATLNNENPNGVLLIDTTSAQKGETANITVTATDPTDKTTVTRSFAVTVSAYNGPTNPPINFVPFANPVATSAIVNNPTTVQLNGQSGYPSTSASVKLTYQLVSQPTHGTITNFNASTGSLTYTPQNNFLGSDTFQYTVTSTGPNATPATLTSLAGTAQINTVSGVTNAVRIIHTVLVVDPPPRTGRGTNTIGITQIPDTTTGGQKLQVTVNGIPDSIQPSTSLISQIVVFGTKARDNITVDPSVTIPATLDGGHGGKNLVKGGGGVTLEHGWFGHTLLAGGVGPNALIGRKGFVRFVPSSATILAFAGIPKPRNASHQTVSPGGTFYRFKHGHLVPVWSLGSPSAPKA